MTVVPMSRSFDVDDQDVLGIDETCAGFPATEMGNAELFTAKNGATVRYDHSARVWRIWKAHYWALDRDGAVNRLAKAALRGRLAAAALILEDARRKQEIQFVLKSETRRSLEAMLTLAESAEP